MQRVKTPVKTHLIAVNIFVSTRLPFLLLSVVNIFINDGRYVSLMVVNIIKVNRH